MKFQISEIKLWTSVVFALLCIAGIKVAAQVPTAIGIQILKADDARRYDSTLENLMKSPNADVRKRSALAAGRIGNEAAIPALALLLANDLSADIRAMAAFALGETESIKAADAVLNAFKTKKSRPTEAETQPVGSASDVTARLVEAAGKIAAANPKDPKTKELGAVIVDILKTEYTRATIQDTPTVLLALTAVLRARPSGADEIVAKFLTNYDSRVRSDAANTIARLKSKAAAETLRKMVGADTEPTARANAARALGNMQDKGSFNELLSAAVEDKDSRIRVSAIGALGSLGDARAAKHLIERGNLLLKGGPADPATAKPAAKPRRDPQQKTELLVIATALGQLLRGSADANALQLLRDIGTLDGLTSPEVWTALARISPYAMLSTYNHEICKFGGPVRGPCWKYQVGLETGRAEVASLPLNDPLRTEAAADLRNALKAWLESGVTAKDVDRVKAVPDEIRSLAAFKLPDDAGLFRSFLQFKDVFSRAAAADVLVELPNTKETFEALKTAFDKALLTDKTDNDAQLSILDALFKLDKKESVGTLLVALSSPDYLVRKKALAMLADKDIQRDFPGIPASIENARAKHKDQVLPYSPAFGTKLGQVLNTDADYRRALSRKNGSVKALLTTEKGAFTIEFYPEDAPLTVDNFIRLARSGYFNGLEVHRVVPNFVMQDGDPRGDGNGGPGWSIRCEINMRTYDRGAVGMALSGKDTGGSQWFVTHSPQPHLDGGYTVFGHVNETDMNVVDRIVRGDKIISVKIMESVSTTKTRRTQK